MNNIISLSDARGQFPALITKVYETNEEVIITVHGKPKVVMVNIEELESLKETAEILAISGAVKSIKEGKEQIRKGEFVHLKDL